MHEFKKKYVCFLVFAFTFQYLKFGETTHSSQENVNTEKKILYNELT